MSSLTHYATFLESKHLAELDRLLDGYRGVGPEHHRHACVFRIVRDFAPTAAVFAELSSNPKDAAMLRRWLNFVERLYEKAAERARTDARFGGLRPDLPDRNDTVVAANPAGLSARSVGSNMPRRCVLYEGPSTDDSDPLGFGWQGIRYEMPAGAPAKFIRAAYRHGITEEQAVRDFCPRGHTTKNLRSLVKRWIKENSLPFTITYDDKLYILKSTAKT